MIFIKNNFLHVLILMLSVQLFPCRAAEMPVNKLVITNEKREDGKKIVSTAFVLKADPEQVYNVLRDVEKFTEFMPGAADVEILEKGKDFQVVKFSGSRGLLSGDITMKRKIDDDNRRIEWNLVDGPPREVCGYWHVERDREKESLTVVHYSNYVDAGALIPGILVRKYLHDDIKRMVPNIIKRVESGGTWLSDDYLKKQSFTIQKIPQEKSAGINLNGFLTLNSLFQNNCRAECFLN